MAVGDEFVGRTYSLPLLAVALGAFPVMASFERHSWALLVGGLGCNSLGAWMRWAATKLALAEQAGLGRTVATASSLPIGFGASVCMVGYSALPARLFAPAERALATSAAVQGNCEPQPREGLQSPLNPPH